MLLRVFAGGVCSLAGYCKFVDHCNWSSHARPETKHILSCPIVSKLEKDIHHNASLSRSTGGCFCLLCASWHKLITEPKTYVERFPVPTYRLSVLSSWSILLLFFLVHRVPSVLWMRCKPPVIHKEHVKRMRASTC